MCRCLNHSSRQPEGCYLVLPLRSTEEAHCICHTMLPLLHLPQVFFMQAGFAMLSAGSVRAKNAKARAMWLLHRGTDLHAACVLPVSVRQHRLRRTCCCCFVAMCAEWCSLLTWCLLLRQAAAAACWPATM